jgi:ferrous iron transport protein A
MNPSSPTTAPVTTFPEGQQVRIHRIGATGRDARRLREQGLHEGCEVCVRSQADTCVLGLDACAYPLRHEIAEQILATPVPARTRLSALAPGQRATLRCYDTDAPPRRLLEMGLVPGTPVQLVRRAPLGDPLYLKVGGQSLAIRERHARLIHVHAA